MSRLTEKHPGELLVLFFIVLGISFVVAVSFMETTSGRAPRAYPGLVNGSHFQEGLFPPRQAG